VRINTVQEYIEWYKGYHGKRPSDKLIDSFCKANRVDKENLITESKVPYFAPKKVDVFFGKESE
jgi:hypothetical protein